MDISAQIRNGLSAPLLTACQQLSALASQRDEELFLVGGAVRDLILERPFNEIDLVLVGDATRLANEAEQTGLGRRIATSQFMTSKLAIEGHSVDLVTARRESYAQPGSLPTIEPAGIEGDLQRRDFSINALAASLSTERFGEVISVPGALDDLAARSLRALHPKSFQDDATRILRGTRYAARLSLTPETETLEWMHRDASYLDAISADRLRRELERFWDEDEPEKSLELLARWEISNHLPAVLLWEATIPDAFSRARSETPEDISLARVYLTVLASRHAQDDGEALIVRLNLAPSDADAVRAFHRWRHPLALHTVLASAKPSEASAMLEGFDLASLTALSITEKDPHVADVLRTYISTWRHVSPALSGDDLISMGLHQGPDVGDYLKRLRRFRLDGEVSSSEEERELVSRWLAEDS